ncbi:Alpha/Beta hydrolase protein [Leucosporidium creatinivorum]|uniref:Alpha/Beta hydrolase protein n=1 Tax=Leucosporidium creatinivorum TaxID=106004 RepID=A0A1Y2G1A8_9BASI|nr:Alpha/Beta hydrolase protein [Leucosporidium creatinivorum]
MAPPPGALVPAATLRRLALLGATFSATAPVPAPLRPSESKRAASTSSSTPLVRLARTTAKSPAQHEALQPLSTTSLLPVELDLAVYEATSSPTIPRSAGPLTLRRHAASRTLLNQQLDARSPLLRSTDGLPRSRILRPESNPNRSTSRAPSRSLSWATLFRPSSRQLEATLQTSGGPQHSFSEHEMSGDGSGGFEHLRRRPRENGLRGAGGAPAGDQWEPPRNYRSAPQVDEINSLLRHPALYDPILKPRNPLVLCHGLYGFDVRGPTFFRLHYWGDLLKILRGTVGAEVFVTAVPGTGSVKHRAHVLHKSLEETPSLQHRDLNFIAHSMGGLDARYLFSQIRPTSYHPRSLTTMSTPHRGSEFMSWCRANIGIGTDFDAMSEAAARALHEDDSSIPYSLKSPILSRAQVEEAKRLAAEEKKKAADAKDAKNKDGVRIPGLPFSLSASVSSYLLDLLDSPAYANLTPSFLREVFNPQTPDRDDIKYYSVASRTERIPIWHPLWLPKQVLDGAEAARQAKGLGAEPRWKGNDGLVSVESAKWGEFLGVVENCDHWEMRGSSGLVSAAESAKAMADVTAGAMTSAAGAVAGEKGAAKAKGWQWQDLYALVGSNAASGKEGGSGKKVKEGGKAEKVSFVGEEEQSDDAKGLASVAGWITKHLPAAVGITSTANPPSSSSSESSKPPSPSPPSNEGSISSSLSPSSSGPSIPTSPSSHANQARMLYGAPAGSGAKPEKFNLERMTLAVCRKLYQEGL